MRVGAFGLGNFTKNTIDANEVERFTGFVQPVGDGSSNFAYPYGMLLNLFRAGGNSGIGFTNQLQILTNRIMFRTKNSENWREWMTVYGSGNTTTDSNGNIKVSSPVVKLFSDGRCELNEESGGIITTRIKIGEYLISGCLGLNSDASWGGVDGGFSIPTDKNNQPLIWLDYEVNSDGSILVKTFHRTHSTAPSFAQNNIDGINDGEPVDIPADQFVSVRVEMPSDSVFNLKQEEAHRQLSASEDEHQLEDSSDSQDI